jgi:hypothetical protein
VCVRARVCACVCPQRCGRLRTPHTPSWWLTGRVTSGLLRPRACTKLGGPRGPLRRVLPASMPPVVLGAPNLAFVRWKTRRRWRPGPYLAERKATSGRPALLNTSERRTTVGCPTSERKALASCPSGDRPQAKTVHLQVAPAAVDPKPKWCTCKLPQRRPMPKPRREHLQQMREECSVERTLETL